VPVGSHRGGAVAHVGHPHARNVTEALAADRRRRGAVVECEGFALLGGVRGVAPGAAEASAGADARSWPELLDELGVLGAGGRRIVDPGMDLVRWRSTLGSQAVR
jgi:hypothetical protein